MPEARAPFTLVQNKLALSSTQLILLKTIENFLGLTKLNSLYSKAFDYPSTHFADQVLKAGNVTLKVNEEAFEQIPKTGPLVVVANHPFGGLEGLLILSLLNKIRNDVKVLANYLLSCIPDLRDSFIFVDPFGGNKATQKNLTPMRETISWVKNGAALGVFPSGTVSHFHFRHLEVTDPAWSEVIARIVRSSRASVVPLYFSGSNSLVFQLLGLIHPKIRTAMLPQELANKENSTIHAKIGSVIPFEKLDGFESDKDLISYLRLRTYILAEHKSSKVWIQIPSLRSFFAQKRIDEDIMPPIAKQALKQEVQSINKSQLLLEQGDCQVLYAQASQIPHILKEIGRLREITFRQAKEGTGKKVDLDNFDEYYTHLFVYNNSADEIVGAYRLVDASWAAKVFGLKGLYTHSLFDYKNRLLRQIGPALELGRSFIRTEYQKNYLSLNLLWKGIAHYVYRHPEYTGLFGTVSISAEYDTISRQLIMLFLKENKSVPELAKLIRARNPMPYKKIKGIDKKSTSIVVRDLEDVNHLLTDLCSEQKSIPILLKQYLKLNGRLLGFNIDKSFGNVLDGLIYVDLRETDPRILERYMGKESARNYFVMHKKLDPQTGTY